MSIIAKQESPTDYFLAGRHVDWFVNGTFIFASNIGSEHIALVRMKERISRLPHEEIIECHLHPESHRGELEEILIKNW